MSDARLIKRIMLGDDEKALLEGIQYRSIVDTVDENFNVRAVPEEPFADA